MKFKVLPVGARVPSSARDAAFLISDNWNDWHKFRTLYRLEYVDETGEEHSIGQVKIGEVGMQPDGGRPNIPSEFVELTEEFFSVGQDDSYYVALNRLGEEKRVSILDALRDIAKNPTIFELAKSEEVTGESLLRSVSVAAVEGQFRRIANGGVRLTKYTFSYIYPDIVDGQEPPQLKFRVKPDSHPPTNIHVIIGRNGVGKTSLLNNMSKTLLEAEADAKEVGRFEDEENPRRTSRMFANLVSVTFSAFDPFLPLAEGESNRIKYSYVGLKTLPGPKPGSGRPKDHAMLTAEFARSVNSFLGGADAKEDRWRKALQTLEADPIFKDAEVANLANRRQDDNTQQRASDLFSRLSSGHKIVLLTITKLVELVEECTLVLLDEPEAHLHPPLLAAFVRAISDLMIDRNGVAIVATHSPVVLQEVPKSCAWKLFRTGAVIIAERPDLETFGENVGTLTRDVFGLEVTHSGFHQLLQMAVETMDDYESVLDAFGGKLGAEAKAIVRAMLASKTQ